MKPPTCWNNLYKLQKRRLLCLGPLKCRGNYSIKVWKESDKCKWPHLRDFCSDRGCAWLTISEVHYCHTFISIAGDHSSFLTAAKPALPPKTHIDRYTMKTFCTWHLLQTDMNACRISLWQQRTIAENTQCCNLVAFTILRPSRHCSFKNIFSYYNQIQKCRVHFCFQPKETSLFVFRIPTILTGLCVRCTLRYDVGPVCGRRLYPSPGYLYNRLLPKAQEKKNRRQKVA